MQYICDATGGRTWFRIETEAEAEAESRDMLHSVADYFKRDYACARDSYKAGQGLERDIGLKDHIRRNMAQFLTLRADDGTALATAMLPPDAGAGRRFRCIIVGPRNRDPYPDHSDAIDALGAHFGVKLPRETCFPYG